jgi:uncharacterized protein YndB with AHSA1/START domain
MRLATRQRLRLRAGTELSFITAGEAAKPAVLLLHGSPSSARMFREVIPELSQAAYVIAPDLPGFGESDGPRRGASRSSRNRPTATCAAETSFEYMGTRMPDHRANLRTDTASRLIGASTHKIYQAFAQPASLMSWLPPSGMSGRVLEYDFREGGRYRIELRYEERVGAGSGKTTSHTDITQGRFLELVPGQRIKQSVEFESSDPSTDWFRNQTVPQGGSAGGTRSAQHNFRRARRSNATRHTGAPSQRRRVRR